MRARYLLIAIAASAGLALATGCGDDAEGGSSAAGDSAGASENAGAENAGAENTGAENTGADTSESTGIVSKEEFIDQANSLCAKRSAEVKVKGRRTFKKVFSEPEAVAAKKMANQVIIPTFEGELRDLKTLNIPAGDDEQISAIYGAIEAMVGELKADPTVQGFYPYTKAEKLAAEYGLTACGHP
jgi:hypothetical protein